MTSACSWVGRCSLLLCLVIFDTYLLFRCSKPMEEEQKGEKKRLKSIVFNSFKHILYCLIDRPFSMCLTSTMPIYLPWPLVQIEPWAWVCTFGALFLRIQASVWLVPAWDQQSNKINSCYFFYLLVIWILEAADQKSINIVRLF